jgi:RNA polymerase sigma-70 factor (ECF subfamily)
VEVSAPEQRLEHLAASVGPDVLAYLARRVEPREDAADVYQQVLTITWRKLRAVPTDDREAFAWMLGVARRCLANHRRAGVRRTALAERVRDDLRVAVRAPDPAVAARANQLLAKLSEDDRELVTLVHWEGLTLAAAAGVLGISAAAARKRMERLRRTLQAGTPAATPAGAP